MSVTESKAKKVKKASPKASTRKADAQSDVLVAVLDSAPVSYTAWSRLFIGDLNCRLIPHTPEEIRGYADSIFAVGQIHNIVVVECRREGRPRSRMDLLQSGSPRTGEGYLPD